MKIHKILLINIILIISKVYSMPDITNNTVRIMNNNITSEIYIDVDPKIVGGENAMLGDNPAQVSLQSLNGKHFCGGNLIDMEHILTAAHCLFSSKGVSKPFSFRIMGNDLYIQNASKTRQMRLPSHIWINILFRSKGHINDIALIRINKPFIKTNTFYGISNSDKRPADNTSCIVYGWGHTIFKGEKSNSLQKATLQISPFDKCNEKYKFSLKPFMLCAFSKGKDSCQGDSGGALICDNKIAGIVSFGIGCAYYFYPGIYTDVSFFNNWIDRNLMYRGSNDDIPTPPTDYMDNRIWTYHYIACGILTYVCFTGYFFRKFIYRCITHIF